MRTIMKKLIAFFLASVCVPLALAAANEKEMDRVKDAGVVLKEILNIPDDIPKDLLDRAECVIVLPSVKKLAIGIGGSYGRGVMVCRSGEHFTGSGAESLMGSKVKLGADAAAAAGPKGRTATAATDVVMRAEILSYSRSRGLFAGVSLEGSTLRPDNSANEKLYGRKLTAKEILRAGKVGVPAAAHILDAELTKASPKNLSDPKSLQ